MKKKMLMIAMVGSVLSMHAERYVLDTISCVLYGDDYTDLITQSEEKRKWLDGQNTRELSEVVTERLIFHDAEKFKIAADFGMVDKYLQALQRQYNCTLDHLKEGFRVLGYTLDEARNQLMMVLTTNTVIDYKVRSRLTVPERDVRAYYQEHPEMVYEVASTLIAFDSSKTEEELEQYIKDMLAGKQDGTLSWGEPFSIPAAEAAEFITRMEPGDVSEPLRTIDGFELFRLIAKRELTLQERYQEISNILRQPRYEQLFNEYEKYLYDSTTIVYFK